MKHPKCLFRRQFKNGKQFTIDDHVSNTFKWVMDGDGVATEKVDGMCCAIIDGKLHRLMNRKIAESLGVAYVDPDPMKKRWDVWVEVDETELDGRWLYRAFVNTPWCREDGTYEAVGPHFKGNPYGLDDDFLERHGRIKHDVPRTYEGIKEYLRTHEIEGLVFWRGKEVGCQVCRKDFGFPWPVKGDKDD